jgi:hypothetical protein
MPILYSKDRKSLQFPANCDGYLQVPYTAGQQKTGIWAHSGGFTFEAIITPYDINGNEKTTYNGTIKSLGQGAKGIDYMSKTSRYASEMVIFYNSNVKVVLENTTTHSTNQPAEYAIKFYLTIGGTTTTITSATVIATSIVENSSLNPTLYSYNNHTPNGEKVNTNINTVYTTTGRLAAADHTKFVVGDILFTSDGASLGTVSSIDTSTGILQLDVSTLTTAQRTIILADGVYRTMNKDALYVEVPHHIAVSYNPTGGRMNIFYDGKLVKTGVHSAGGNFSLAESDINIGQQSDAASQTLKRRSQFMGEMHEMVFINKYKKGIGSTNTLTPFYGDVLLYFDFEEANLNG